MAINGFDFVGSVDGAVFAAETNSRLSLPSDQEDILDKTVPGWRSSIQTITNWSASATVYSKDTNGDYEVAGEGTTLLEYKLVEEDTYTKLIEVNSLDVELTQEVDTRGGIDDPLYRFIRHRQRMAEFGMEGTFYDPSNSKDVSPTDSEVASNFYKALLENKTGKGISDGQTLINRTNVHLRVTIGDIQIETEVKAGDFDLEAPGDDDVTVSISFLSQGAVTVTDRTGGANTTTMKTLFLDVFSNQTKPALKFYQQDNSNAQVDGSIEFSGNAIMTSLSTVLEQGEPIEYEIEFEGDGVLDIQTYNLG